jgi:hypothetical protein
MCMTRMDELPAGEPGEEGALLPLPAMALGDLFPGGHY